MAFPGSSIVPKKLVESGHDLNAKPIGSGPFKFVSYQPRSMVKFEKNPDYYEAGKPYFDAMEFHLIADVTALTNAVMSGTVNFSNEIPPKDWATVSSTPGIVGPDAGGLALLLAAAEQRDAAARQAEGAAGDRPRTSTVRQSSPVRSSARRRRSLAASFPQWNWAYAGLKVFKPERRSREGQGPDGRGRPCRTASRPR